MSDQTKDVIETSATVALTAAAVTGAMAAAIPGILGILYAEFRKRREEKWWNLVTDGDEVPGKTADRVAAGLATDNANVVAGVVGGAHAAASAIELAAVPIIAVLSRRYLKEGDIPLWFYRGALDVIQRLNAMELRALRTLLMEIAVLQSNRVVVLAAEYGDAEWYASHAHVEGDEGFEMTDARAPLTRFASPSRLFAYLMREGLAFPNNGLGSVGLSEIIIIERDTAAWLREAMVTGMS
jgi:hypothetical protein